MLVLIAGNPWGGMVHGMWGLLGGGVLWALTAFVCLILGFAAGKYWGSI